MSKMCENCRYFVTNGCSNVCTLYCCGTSTGEHCRNYEAPTVFDSIKQSEETLAKKFVYAIAFRDHSPVGINMCWKSTIMPGETWNTEKEAYDATVAKLKEVEA